MQVLAKCTSRLISADDISPVLVLTRVPRIADERVETY